MPSILLVTAVCKNDILLVYKRLEWMKSLEVPAAPKDILLINDGSISDMDFSDLTKAHVDSGLFPKVQSRKILQFPQKSEWPYNVNHVWRATAMIVAGQYANPFDGSNYYAWFYFEPDVTPLKSDFAGILETQYLTNRKQFMGAFNVTTTSKGAQIRHMNGAAVYPISLQYYNQSMMLVDGIPWDVAGLGEMEAPRMAEIPSDAYALVFGTTNYKRDGQNFTATQSSHDGKISSTNFILSGQTLHHGCKDGSFIDCLQGKVVIENKRSNSEASASNGLNVSPKFEPPGKPPYIFSKSEKTKKEEESILADFKSGMKWRDLIGKYKISPRDLKKIIG